MATVGTKYGAGTSLPAKEGHSPSLATVLREMIDDLTAIRTAFVTLTAKIDADSTDTGGDSDYASTCDPAALKSIKGS